MTGAKFWMIACLVVACILGGIAFSALKQRDDCWARGDSYAYIAGARLAQCNFRDGISRLFEIRYNGGGIRPAGWTNGNYEIWIQSVDSHQGIRVDHMTRSFVDAYNHAMQNRHGDDPHNWYALDRAQRALALSNQAPDKAVEPTLAPSDARGSP
jgi:hypothetical protein